MSKKLLSLAIAICMVAAMLPMTFSSASAAGEVYQFRYDFNNSGFSGTVVSEATYADTNGHWAHSGFLFNENWIDRDEVKANRLHLSTLGGNVWYALEINVPVSGVYDVKYEYMEIKGAGTIGDVYIFPAGTTLTPGTKFGTSPNNIASKGTKIAENIDYTCETGDSASNSATYENLNLAAGKNLVVFVAQDGAAGYTYPSALTLTTADAASTDYSDAYVGYVNVAKTTLDAEIAETTTATVSAYKMSDKSAIESGVTFRSSNEAVATVAADGTVTAKKAGKATIYAVCEAPAVGNILGTEITVTAPAYRVAYDFDNRVVKNQTGNDPVSNVTYERAYGMWRFIGGVGTAQVKSLRINGSTKEVGQYIALGINVPKTDKYDVDYAYYKLVSGEDIYGSKGDVYILPGDTSLSDIEAAKAKGTLIASVDYSSGEKAGVIPVDTVKNISLTKGENILLLVVTGEGDYATTAKYYTTPSSLVITTSAAAEDATDFESVYVGKVSLNESALNMNGTTTATAEVYMADTTADGAANGTAIASGITYTSSNPTVATVDASSGAVTAVGEGETTISATCSTPSIGSIIGTKLMVTKSDSQLLDEAFDADENTTQYAPSVSATGVSGATAIKQADGTYKVSAPETKDGAKFLYWVKGMSLHKRIVSLENEFNYKPEGGDRNFLISVYETATGTAKAEFYNANGQLIESNETGEFPSLPSMPGFTSQGSWTCYNDGEIYDGTEEIELSGTMIFVANYNDVPVNVTVNGKSVAYGTLVECTPDESAGTFKWWTKKVNGVSEIVSTAEDYSFYAWENCNVVGVYGAEATGYTGAVMKIVLDTFGTDSVMAEFIGFEGKTVVEKGIKWNGTNIAMTTDKSQFTLSGAGTYTGYAIVMDSEGNYTLITDGEATVSAK